MRLFVFSLLQGRPKSGPEDKFRLTPVAPRLSELLGKPVSSVGWLMVCGSSSNASVTSCRPWHHRQSCAALQASHIPSHLRRPTALLCCAARSPLISPPQVKKLNDCIGDEVKQAVADAKEGEVRCC